MTYCLVQGGYLSMSTKVTMLHMWYDEWAVFVTVAIQYLQLNWFLLDPDWRNDNNGSLFNKGCLTLIYAMLLLCIIKQYKIKHEKY